VAAVPVQLSDGGTSTLAQIQAPSGQWLTVTWQAGQLPTPTVTGAVATYADVFPGVDLSVTVTPSGLSEVLIVKSAQAASDPGLGSVDFGIDDGNLTTTEASGGTAVAAAADGSPQLTSSAPTWWDSSSPGSGPAGPGGDGVPRPLDHTISDSQITVDAGQAARAPGATYPVYIDPPVDTSKVSYTYVDSAYPTTSYWNGSGAPDSYAHVGYINAANSDDGQNHVTRSFWSMNTSAVVGKHIDDAQFNTYEVYSSSCTARTVELWTAGAATASTTWNSQPGLSALSDSANVAYGYNASCPSHAVGFDALAAVQRAADAGDGAINFALRATASQESDWLSWKKFASNPTLHIDYHSVPGRPAWRSLSGCTYVCTTSHYTADGTPTVTALALDSDGGTLTYHFEICYGDANGTGSCPSSGTVSGQAVNTGDNYQSHWASYTSGPLSDNNYGYRAYACSTVCGPWSDWFWFTLDRTAPPAPTIVASSDVANSTMSTPSRFGVVGETKETITLSAPADPHVYGYSWALVPSGAPVTLPANLSCGEQINGYATTCAGAVGGTVTVTVTMPEQEATFEAITFSASGVTASGGMPSAVTFHAQSDYSDPSTGYASPVQQGHSWLTDAGQPGCFASGSTAVADSATPGQPLISQGGTACLISDSTAPIAPSGFGTNTALQLNSGSNSFAASAGSIIDTTKNFTVAAWLKPSDASSSLVESALTQDGANASVFFLQNSLDHWRFCMSAADSASFTGNCAISAGTVSTTAWTYVVGEYEADDNMLLLYTSSSGQVGTPTIATQTQHVASSGPVTIGRDKLGTSYRFWSGEILDPVVAQGIAAKDQLSQLGGLTAPSALNKPVIGS